MALIKLLHILFLFVWIGSLLATSRFLAYLPKEEPIVQKRLLELFRRAYLFIDLPAMCLSLVLGVILFIGKQMTMAHGYLHMKFTFAFFLIVIDILVGKQILKMSKGSVSGKGKRFRIYHGTAALCLMGILASVYILKNRMPDDSSLAKKEENRMISPLKNKEA